MIKKILSNILLGLRGILFNTYISPKQKTLLYIDYIKFIILLTLVTIFKIKITCVKIWSFKYTIYIQNYVTFFYIFNEIFCKSVYTPTNIKTYYDLGSNIGLTILWYKFFNPNLIVYAFEPDKYNYRLLTKNIKSNKISKVKTYNTALSNKKGKALFYTIHDNIQNLDSALTLNQKYPYEKYTVDTDLLSSYIHSRVDLVKMDIEGGEYQVFHDLFKTNTILYIKEIIFEMHHFDKSQRDNSIKIINKLKKIGKISSLENSKVTTIYHFSSKELI